MSLSQALATAMSGLRVTQSNLALVSSNIANAQTPGYVKKTANQVTVVSGEFGGSVRFAGVNRELDAYVQRQLLTERSGAEFAGLRSTFLGRLQTLYGTPGSQGTLESTFSNFTGALQALSTSSDSSSARIAVVNAAQAMAQQLNGLTRGIQSLRSNAEAGLTDATSVANNAMAQIATINNQLRRGGATDAASAAMLDQRDQFIAQLSQLMDVRVINNAANQVSVFTTSGVELVGTEASTISFNPQGTVTASTLWNANADKSNLGTMSLTFPHGGTINLNSPGTLRSGTIAAYLELRDNTLVEAQTQIDQFAAAMASAVSDKVTGGTAVASAGKDGFDLDVAGLKTGNVVQITYTDTATNTQRKLSIVRVDDPSVLPLSNNATNDSSDTVLGIDFSGGMASVVSQLNAALGPARISFANPSGSTLRVLDDGAPGKSRIDGASTTTTVSSLTSGGAELPLFTDGGILYTGATGVSGTQSMGFAGRITINPALLGDPSRLVVFNTSPLTPSGDTTRPDFLYNQLTSSTFVYSPATGIGTESSPFKSSLLNFAQQIISAQGQAADAAQQLSDGQNVVLATLEKKFDDVAGVNVDEEMAHLLALQNAYSANARVMSVIKEMFQALMQA